MNRTGHTSRVTLNFLARSFRLSSNAMPVIMPRILGSAKGDLLPCYSFISLRYRHQRSRYALDRDRSADPSLYVLEIRQISQLVFTGLIITDGLNVGAFVSLCIRSSLSPRSSNVFFPVSFASCNSLGYAGCEDTTKSMSCQ
jgi:hypothetical protein